MSETFGNRLAKARKIKGLTQVELAQQVGISPGAIVKYETGRSFPEVSNLIEISNILAASIDYLLKGVTTRPPESNEIVEILKGRIEDKEKLLINAEKEISRLEKEIEEMKNLGKSKDRNKKDQSETEKEGDADRSFKSHAV